MTHDGLVKLKLDLHEIYNRGDEIEQALRSIIDEAVAKKAPLVEIIPGKGSGQLKKRVLRNDFDALAIVAPPKALGVIKKCLHKEVEKRLVCTVNKEMSGRPVPDIEALLEGETRAELPNA